MTIKEKLFEYILKNFNQLSDSEKNKIGSIFYYFCNKDYNKSNEMYMELLSDSNLVQIGKHEAMYEHLLVLFMESLTNIENLRENLLFIGYRETTVDLSIETFTEKISPSSCVDIYKAIVGSSSKFKKEVQNILNVIEFIKKEIKI